MASDDFAGFAPPPFNADNALVQLKRSLRDLKLVERGMAFELRGKRVAEAQVEDGVMRARIARRLMLTPEWDRLEIKTAADQRKFVDELKKRLQRWEREE